MVIVGTSPKDRVVYPSFLDSCLPGASSRQASSGAQPAKPQTLRFALELSNNVSSSVKDVVFNRFVGWLDGGAFFRVKISN